jgi:hypothetical protein
MKEECSHLTSDIKINEGITKEHCRPIFFKNIDAKILKEKLSKIESNKN